MKALGLYLHLPFCRSKCLYCDFCSLPRPDARVVEAYVARLTEELGAWGKRCADYTVDTVYLGGGTPTAIEAEQLARILDTLSSAFSIAAGAEITVECNPVTEHRALFSTLRASGVNRLSVGLQSAHADELRALGRLHSFADFQKTLEDARAAGLENISVDLMQGIPLQTPARYLETLERVLALSPTHISSYGLSVEEDTPFGRMGDRLILPDEEASRSMYFEGLALLKAHGFAQYEISNFARQGFASRHNLKYWSVEEYLGLGVAAYSDFGGERFGNSRDVDAFLRGEDITVERERPDGEERMREFVMLGLRLASGVNERAFEARFGTSFKPFADRLARFLPAGLVTRTEEGYALTPPGMYVSNAILSEIL